MEESLDCEKCLFEKKCSDLPSGVMYEYDGERLTVCPKILINKKSMYLISLFGHYRSGHMLYGGGVVDQPYWYLQAMMIIEKVTDKCMKDKTKEREARCRYKKS